MSTTRRYTKEDYSLESDDWIAECLSLGPERSLRFPRTTSSWDALCILYLVSHLESHYWMTDDIHRRIGQQAYAGNYEGEWKTVQEILEQYCQTPKEFFDIFLKFHSPEEFFGNLVPRARRLTRGIDNKKRDPHGPVRRTLRHRGFRDKGTLRPSHQRPVVCSLTDNRLDRRKKIKHPLIYEEEEKTAGEEQVLNDRRKEVT